MRDRKCFEISEDKDACSRSGSPATPVQQTPTARSPDASKAPSDKVLLRHFGEAVLFQAQEHLSSQFRQKHGDEGSHWRTHPYGGSSFGTSVFTHERFRGKRDEMTPDRGTHSLGYSDSVFKIFWIDCPSDPEHRGARDLRDGFDKETGVLSVAARSYSMNPEENPVVTLKDSGTFFVNSEKGPQEVGWIEMERVLEPEDLNENEVRGLVNDLHDKLRYTHNDIQYTNIMRRKDGRLVLIDLEKATPITDTQKTMDHGAALEAVKAERLTPSFLQRLVLAGDD